MELMAKFYLTTAIPYTNAAPHVGHALEFVQADVIARYRRLLGDEVCLLSGGDENALKNVQAAEKAGVPVKQFIDVYSQLFQKLAQSLNVQFDIFQKGSDQIHHFPSSQKLWELCARNGDIYKKPYEGLYCLGCEAFYTPDELDSNGECSEHPGKKLDKVSEENYFFKLSKYQTQLIDLISSDTLKIVPDFRKNEVLSFLKQPLHDISISRTNARAKNWGVPVPGDATQRIYVWFDALNIYQSGIGFGWDEKTYHKWWPADVHVIGKGIIRFHAVYWPAFLLSAKLSLPKTLFVHGYFTVNGQKMSKTIGNIIDPSVMIEKYGSDALRYYLLREIPPFADGDFSERRFKELYNADLANGLGNVIARTAKLASNAKWPMINAKYKDVYIGNYKKAIEEFRLHDAIACVWDTIKTTDQYINDKKPWTLSGTALQKILEQAIQNIRTIATQSQPFLPKTAEIILKQFGGPTIKSEQPLFPRIV
ncbi:methionine--tRNA ligase [Patescibacteria group bacterium]|nr:methionine--tRNA ligase [Patescibacteria group bacterium]MBU1473097.1 methionine--tRNA ligase [Patescibacteria group bacterium]MBU2459634.1 methionine--tRNA ligase [Patescibacteria group bacterium]MBU2544463.1 methionine--tRNA ligase [Patescibacteria group bacterium]